MRNRILISICVAALSAGSFGAVASAQTPPPPPLGQRPLPPAPPLAQRPAPAPPLGQRPEDRRADHRETEAEIRDREQKREADERSRRSSERKDKKAWEAKRGQRAADTRNDLAQTYGSTLENPQARAELSTHADRMARLNRIMDLAEDQHDTALQSRCQAVMQREIARDTHVMQGLRGGAQ